MIRLQGTKAGSAGMSGPGDERGREHRRVRTEGGPKRLRRRRTTGEVTSPTRPPGPPSPVLRGDAKPGSSPGIAGGRNGSRCRSDLQRVPLPHGTLGGPDAGAPEREGPFPLSPGGGHIQVSGHALRPGVGAGRTSIDSSSPVPVPGLAIRNFEVS
jgi:hypothetical protein